jgi:hydroxymethylbilane synthase
MILRISARKSDLARLQAYRVGSRLAELHPGLTVQYSFKESLGDKNQEDPLWKLPERGVFTEDFVEDLRQGRTDLVVHSWKDLPTDPRPGLEILATLPRADVRDLLLLRRDAVGKSRLCLLTSSPRRDFSTQAHLRELLPFRAEEITTKAVRGNIATRLKKLAAGEGDGLFMAKAALDRLLSAQESEFAPSKAELRELLNNFYWMVLPLSLFPTAPAQGALAVEAAAGREDLRALLAPAHCASTAACVEMERRRFSSYGGGCHQKIGLTVLPHPRFGTVEFFHGEPANQPAQRTIRFERTPESSGPLSRWPEKMQSLFRRVPLHPTQPGGADFFVARAEALPQDWSLDGRSLVWVSGVQTWKKLAARGIWVHGCCDGLGETKPEVDALAGRPAKWVKLTHSESGNDSVFPCLATYRLEAGDLPPPPLVDSYFWPSESLFRWAVAADPRIRSARHAAGPGYTAQAIEKELGRPVEVFYNFAHWQKGDPYEES